MRLPTVLRAAAGCAVSRLDDLSGDLCGALCEPFPLLRLPYYWDEAGYYIPAAWDFFRTGSLIPDHHADQRASAAAQHLPGAVVEALRLLSRGDARGGADGGSLGLLAVWRLAMRVAGCGMVAFWTVVLTGLYPIWFAQSTLAHADIFAAACTLWGLVYALPDRDRKPWAAALWFVAAALCKETAIAIPLTLAAMSLVEGFRAKRPARYAAVARERPGSRVASCRWRRGTAWHYAKTGFLFGNPEYLRYNAQATLTRCGSWRHSAIGYCT